MRVKSPLAFKTRVESPNPHIYKALDRLSNTQVIFMTRLAIFLGIKTIFDLFIT
jgi:hypothetical protein